MPGPSERVPSNALTALDVAKRVCASDAKMENKATLVQLYFDASLNEELEELAIHILSDWEVELRKGSIAALMTSITTRNAVDVTVTECRRQIAALLRSHKRDIE